MSEVQGAYPVRGGLFGDNSEILFFILLFLLLFFNNGHKY